MHDCKMAPMRRDAPPLTLPAGRSAKRKERAVNWEGTCIAASSETAWPPPLLISTHRRTASDWSGSMGG